MSSWPYLEQTQTREAGADWQRVQDEIDRGVLYADPEETVEPSACSTGSRRASNDGGGDSE